MPHLAQLLSSRHTHARSSLGCATAEECFAGNDRGAQGLGGACVHLWTQSRRIKSDV